METKEQTTSANTSRLPCPLALSHFPQLSMSTSCPEYTSLLQASKPDASATAVANVLPEGAIPLVDPQAIAMKVNTLPTTESLSALQLELKLLEKSAADRAQVLQEELMKLDHHMKSSTANRSMDKTSTKSEDGPGSVQNASDSSVPLSAGGRTIKLDLKKLKAVDESHDAKAKGAVSHRASSSTMSKRKRESSIDSRQSEVDTNSNDPLSPTPIHENKLLSYQKKKQKLNRDRERSDSNASLNAPSVEMASHDGAQARQNQVEEPSKIKPTSQISINVFWNYVDAFFRNITEDDLRFLEPTAYEDPTPFMIPPLGRSYLETWTEEDKSLSGANTATPSPKKPGTTNPLSSSKVQIKSQLYDDASLVPEETYCGPLTERLIAALMEEKVDTLSDTESQTETNSDVLQSPQPPVITKTTSQIKDEMYDMEERLKRELLYVGLLDEDQVELLAKDDDQICNELRVLQQDLRRVAQLNNERRSILYDRAAEEMAFQEFLLVLDEINKQVDLAYQKRSRLIKKKKKLAGGVYVKPAPDGVLPLLERRRRLLQELDPIFPSNKPRLAPTTSLFGEEPEWATAHALARLMDRPVEPPKEKEPPPQPPVAVSTPRPQASISHKSLPGTDTKDSTVAAVDQLPAIPERPTDNGPQVQTTPSTETGHLEDQTTKSKPRAKGSSQRKPKKSMTANKTKPSDDPNQSLVEAESPSAVTDIPTSTTSDTKKPRKKYNRKKKTDGDAKTITTSDTADILSVQPTVVDESGVSAMDLDAILPDGAMSMVPDWMRNGGFFG